MSTSIADPAGTSGAPASTTPQVHVDYSTLTLVRCTEEQKVQTRRNHFPEWGSKAGFTEETWLKRDEVMEKEEWAVGDGFVTWALVPRSDPQTLNVLCHCETYRRCSILLPPGETKPIEGRSYGVACVFTPIANRGKAYARHMLRLLHYVLAPPSLLPPFPSSWGQPPSVEGFKDAQFSILFSGIGGKFYASCRRGDGDDSEEGWVRQSVTTRTWEVPKEPVEIDQTGWEWLDEEGVGKLETGFGEEMKEEIRIGDESKTRVAVLPTESLLRLHAVRNTLSPSFNPPSQPPLTRSFGLLLPAPSPGAKRPFVTYRYPIHLTKTPRLEVSAFRHPVPFEAVVAAAQRERVESIQIWGGRGGWDQEKVNGKGPIMNSDEEMPCLVVYGKNNDEVKWKWMEYYTWC